MKGNIVGWFAAVAMSGASVIQAADSLKLSASYADKVVTGLDGAYTSVSGGSGSITATIPISGVDISSLDENAFFSISLGDYVEIYNMRLGADSTYKPGKQSARWTDSSATMSLSWTAAALTISGSLKYDIFHVGSLYRDSASKIQNDPQILTFMLGNYYFGRKVFLNGNRTSLTVTRGSGDNTHDFNLLTVSVSGEIDVTPPTVTITSPAVKAIVASGAVIELTGKVTDNKGVSKVLYCVSANPKLLGDDTFEEADADPLSGAWAGSFTALPGTNYIFVTAIDTSSNAAPPVRRILYSKPMSQLTIYVAEGQGTFSGVADGQMLEIGRSYTVTTKPAAGQMLAYWSTDAGSGHTSTFSFTMQPDMNIAIGFHTNPFPALKGTYTGLFFDHDHGVNPTNAGLYTATISSSGAYSAKLVLLSGSYSFSGRLTLPMWNADSAGAYFELSRPKLPTLSASLLFSLDGSGGVTGSIAHFTTNSDGTWDDYPESNFDGGIRRPPTTKGARKIYDVAFSRGTAHNDAPYGHSYGIATVAGSGTVTLALNPADKHPVLSVGSSVNADGSVPVFAPLYAHQGVILGWLALITNSPQTDLTGDNIVWVKNVTSQRVSSLYTNDFYLIMSAQGSLSVAPKTGTNLFGWTNGFVGFSDSNFEADALTPLTFNPSKNQFTFASGQNPNKVSLTLAAATGLLSGSFTPTDRSKPLSFKGLILPKQGVGYGFFTDTNCTGPVLLLPPTTQPPIPLY